MRSSYAKTSPTEVDTGKWLPRQRVLISPISIVRAEWGHRRLVLSLSRDQVRNAPDIDSHKPEYDDGAHVDLFAALRGGGKPVQP
jgi:hypothetical protein